MILLLAGTREARDLARAIAARGWAAEASLAGVTRTPADLGLPTRIGGFGGAAGFTRYLDEKGVTAVLDATHPFAANISARTAAICAARGLPCLHLRRPPWQAAAGDRWFPVATPERLIALIPTGKRLFLATGRQSLPDMAPLARGRTLFLRQIDPPDAPPPPWVELLIGRPPFSVASERTLLSELAIDWLVVKNAGGAGGMAKLTAARALGLPVAMIERPAVPPDVPIVSDVPGALAWLDQQKATAT